MRARLEQAVIGEDRAHLAHALEVGLVLGEKTLATISYAGMYAPLARLPFEQNRFSPAVRPSTATAAYDLPSSPVV